MRKYLLLLLFMISLSTHAQLRLPGIKNDISNALASVLADFPEHFVHIIGPITDKSVQTTEYASRVYIPGSDSSVIIQTGPTKDNVYSWKTVLVETDDFDKAKAKFHEYYSKIKATRR